MRRKVGSVFAHLCPNKFNRVEFGSTDREVVDMQTWIPGKKLLHRFTFMDGMVIPHQNDLTWNDPQQLLQESHNFFATQATPVRTRGQFDRVAIRFYQQRTQQVQPLVMLQAGADGWRVSARRPAAFERRDQREAAFIYKNQPGLQFTPLFLSLAKLAASRKQSLPRRVGSPAAAASGCSSPCDPSHARLHWAHTGPQTVPRSHARSVPASSSLLHIRGHTRRTITLLPAAAVARCSTWSDAPVVVHSSLAGSLADPATDRRSVQ